MAVFSAGRAFPGGGVIGGADTCRSWDEVERHLRASSFLPGEMPEAFRDRQLQELGGLNLGWHSNSPGERSRDVISMRGACVTDDGRRIGFQSADVIGGSTGPNPTPTFQMVTDYRPEAQFVPWATQRTPVAATGRNIGRLSVSGTGWLLGGRPWRWVGATAFDLPVRLWYGDSRFLDWMAAQGFTLARLALFTLYRMPRWWTDGLPMMELALKALQDRKMCAELVVVCDSKDWGMTRAEVEQAVSEAGALAGRYGNCTVEIFNEIGHGGQLDDSEDPDWQRWLRDMVPAHVPVSVGSTHGGEVPKWDGGEYMTQHASRQRTPEENAAIMAAAQAAFGVPVIDDEAQGVDEQPRGDARHADPGLSERQAAAAKAHGLGGVTFHSEAGLSATYPFLGPVHLEAADRFVGAA